MVSAEWPKHGAGLRLGMERGMYGWRKSVVTSAVQPADENGVFPFLVQTGVVVPITEVSVRLVVQDKAQGHVCLAHRAGDRVLAQEAVNAERCLRLC